MTELEVKDYIGEENWDSFCEWMRGQTVGAKSKPGGGYEADYYEWDVKAFKDKIDTGYDRQENPLTWD